MYPVNDVEPIQKDGRRVFAVWETEYPDEGSTLHAAYSDSGARRMWRRETRTVGPISQQPDLTTWELDGSTLARRALLVEP